MLLIQMQHLLHVTYFIFIFFVVFFTEPNFGKKQKLTEIHQALIRWKRKSVEVFLIVKSTKMHRIVLF